MDSNDVWNLPEPKTIAEKTTWVLDQMIRSSQIRENHFKYVAENFSEYIVENVKLDPTTGVVTENRNMYDAMNVDYIFRVMGVIESFQGAMAAAWKFSAKGNPNLEKVFDILVNPRGYRGAIENKIRKKPFSEKTVCRLFGISLLTRFEKQIASKLRTLLAGVFDRLEETAWYSQRFWDEYKDIRHIYAHNFRFIFFEHILPMWKAEFDESVIGFLKDSGDLAQGMAFIGASQRVAMGNLVFLLSNLERWIYKNLKASILNKCKPVLPPGVLYLDEKQHEEYEEIWKAQGYNYYGPNMKVGGRIRVDNQAILVVDFLGVLKKWGRALKVYGKDGKEFQFPVEKLQQELDEIRKRKRQA